MLGPNRLQYVKDYARCAQCGLLRPERDLFEGACKDVAFCEAIREGRGGPRPFPPGGPPDWSAVPEPPPPPEVEQLELQISQLRTR